jgi:hypothetical protein
LNNFHQNNRFKYLTRGGIIVAALIAIAIYMNYDVSNRSYDYASHRKGGGVESPDMMDLLCFRRHVWVEESVRGKEHVHAYRIDLFGIERDYRRDRRHRPVSRIGK